MIGPLGALLAVSLSLLTRALLVDADPSTRWLASSINTGGTRAAGVNSEKSA